MLVFRYYTRMRPPMPGAIPRKGLVNTEDFGERKVFRGLEAWGYAEYDRALDGKEIRDYELAESPDNPFERE